MTKKKKLPDINYNSVYERVIVGLKDNKEFIEKYKKSKNYLKGLQLADTKKEHQTVVEYALPIVMTHLPNILPAGLNLDVEYSIDKEQESAYYSKMLLKNLYKRNNYYYQYVLALLDVMSSGLGWTHQTYRSIYKPDGKVWKRMPIIERVSPVDMVWDRTGYHFEYGFSGCINWVARIIRRPTIEIKADERYNKNKEELKGKSIISERERKDKDLKEFKSEGLKQSELYEVWLIPERRVITFAEELTSDKWLRDMENPYIDKDKYVIPFTLCKGYEIPDEFVARSETDVIEGTQDELNLLRGYLINYFFRMIPTWLFKQGKINEDQKKELESGDFGMFIEILETGAIDTLPIPNIPLGAMIQHAESIKREDIPMQSGLSEHQLSRLPRGERTATAVLEASQGGRPRTTIKKNFFAIFMDKSLNNLLQILQMKMKGEYPITYPRVEVGKKLIVTEHIKKEHIQGNLNVVVDISDQRSIDAQMQIKEKMAGLEKAYSLNPESMDVIEVQKGILRLAGYDNPDIWFPQTRETLETEEMEKETPTEMPTEPSKKLPLGVEKPVTSPVTERLAEAGAYTKHRPSFVGGIADKLRSWLGGK